MTIGQLARRVGVRPSAIRYYEAQGVLGPPARSANAYRLYGAEAVARLRFVRRAKALGFSLDEVRRLIAASRVEPPCAACRDVIARHLEQVANELHRLRALQGRLKRLLRQPLPEAAGGICPLIEGEPVAN